jgi:hypothetical protein
MKTIFDDKASSQKIVKKNIYYSMFLQLMQLRSSFQNLKP